MLKNFYFCDWLSEIVLPVTAFKICEKRSKQISNVLNL